MAVAVVVSTVRLTDEPAPLPLGKDWVMILNWVES